MTWRVWLAYGWGFAAGAILASYVALSCAPGHAQSQEVQDAIHQAALEQGVSEAWLRRIIFCESRFHPWATSRGGHMGLAQFSARTWTWMSAQAGYGGASPYDPYAATQVLAYALRQGYASHWSCR